MFINPNQTIPFPQHTIQKIEEAEKSDLSEKEQYDIQEYLKVGLFCGWNWNEYLDTPPWVIEAISKEIDKRLAQYNKSKGIGVDDGKPKLMPLNFMHLSLLLALSSLFGSEGE